MTGYFEHKPASNGQFMFNLKAGNHEVILTSELYTTKAACLAGIESVRKNAPVDAHFIRKQASKRRIPLLCPDRGQPPDRRQE